MCESKCCKNCSDYSICYGYELQDTCLDLYVKKIEVQGDEDIIIGFFDEEI